MGEKIRFSAEHIMERGDYIDTPEEMISEFLFKRMAEAIIDEAKYQLEVELREALKASIVSNFDIENGTTIYKAGISIEISPENYEPLKYLSEDVQVVRNK